MIPSAIAVPAILIYYGCCMHCNIGGPDCNALPDSIDMNFRQE